jgi:hypothetical protein
MIRQPPGDLQQLLKVKLLSDPLDTLPVVIADHQIHLLLLLFFFSSLLPPQITAPLFPPLCRFLVGQSAPPGLIP